MHNKYSNQLEGKEENHSTLKYHHDQLGKIFSGVIVVWLGVSFLLKEQNYFYDSEWWAYFLLGLGIIFFVEAIIRMTRPEYTKPYTGKIIAGAILVAIGAGNIYDLKNWWPVIIIAIGVIIILLNIQQKNR